MHLGVVGQAGVGLGHGGGQLGGAAVGAQGPEQGVVLRQGFAIDECLGDDAALGQLGLDPVGVDIAPVTGDELMLLAALEVEKTVFINVTQVAGGPPWRVQVGLVQVTEQHRSLDQHFAVFGQADFNVGQRSTDTARTVCLRMIEAHHRRALRQPVTLVNRHAQLLRTLQQGLGYARAADGSKSQALGVERLLLGGDYQHQQQLRHQDQAVGLARCQATEQLGGVHCAGALDAQAFLAGQAQSGAGIQGGVAAEVFQQYRDGQQRQVVPRVPGMAGLMQLAGNPQQAVGAQADPFGGPGGAGRERQLGGI